MLVLSRKTDESIRIGQDIVITILGLDRGTVRLGIVAPEYVSVHRQEVYDRIHTKGEHNGSANTA